MLNIALIGAGAHSRGNHLPALSKLCKEYPDRFRAHALCDIDQEVCQKAASKFAFGTWHSSVEHMLAASTYDACIAVTPVSATAEVSRRIAAEGIPLLMEKPPGRDIDEARALIPNLIASNTPIMVSLNRRFDPTVQEARTFLKAKDFSYIRGSMIRTNRVQTDFMFETAIHMIDTVRFIAGDPQSCRNTVIQTSSAPWAFMDLTFSNGRKGAVEVIPTAGTREERYEIFGDGFHIIVSLDNTETGRVQIWEEDHLVIDKQTERDAPLFMRNGCYYETLAFLTAVEKSLPMSPSPADALASTEFAASLQQSVQNLES